MRARPGARGFTLQGVGEDAWFRVEVQRLGFMVLDLRFGVWDTGKMWFQVLVRKSRGPFPKFCVSGCISKRVVSISNFGVTKLRRSGGFKILTSGFKLQRTGLPVRTTPPRCWAAYRGTSLIRNRHPEGPYSRTMPRLLWRS